MSWSPAFLLAASSPPGYSPLKLKLKDLKRKKWIFYIKKTLLVWPTLHLISGNDIVTNLDVSVLELLFLDLLGENRLANHSLVLDFESKLGVLFFTPATSGLSRDPFAGCC